MSYLGFCPPGVVMPFAGTTAPDGWLLCDGSDIPKTTYANLFAVISNLYDTQVNPTTGSSYVAPALGNFRLPDYRGLFLRGAGTAIGGDATSIGGHQVGKTARNGLSASSGDNGINHSHPISADGSHDHAVRLEYGTSNVNTGAPGQYNQITNNTGYAYSRSGNPTTTEGSHSHYGGTSSVTVNHNHLVSIGGGDNETRPVNRGVNYIIKF